MARKKSQSGKLVVDAAAYTGSHYSQLVSVTVTDFDITLEFVYINPPGFTELQSEDKLSFMDVFTFPNLEKVHSDLKKAGYKEEKISEIISGLKTLPEYSCD